MKRIWRYLIEPDSEEDGFYVMEIQMPLGAKILSVGRNEGVSIVWAEVDDEEEGRETRRLFSVGTGYGAVPEKASFLGTVIDTPFVWHIYVDEEK